MKSHYCLLQGAGLVLAFFLPLSVGATATHLVELTPLSIAVGEAVDFSTIVDTVQVGGQPAKVHANFTDTSRLAAGRHTLVYTAMAFNGLTQVKEVTLDVGTTNALTAVPIFTGLADAAFSQGKLLNLRSAVRAVAAAGKNLAYEVSIEYPEHLAPGTHTVYYTTVDEDGKSTVEKIQLSIDPVTDEVRRLEWARLGAHLYEKYFEPARYSSSINPAQPIFKFFSYSPTEAGITVDLTFRSVHFDSLSFDPFPIKIEPLMGRMLLLLEELHHHRYLWLDQEKIVIGLAQRSFLLRAGAPAYRKDRGIYSMRIPVETFKNADFDDAMCTALRKLSELPVDMQNHLDGKGEVVSHKLYTDSDSGITTLFMVDYGRSFVSTYRTAHTAGELTFEENFDYTLFKSEYDSGVERLKNLDFGRFTNPKLPFIEQQYTGP